MYTPQEVLKLGARYRRVDSTVGLIPFDSGNTRTLELPRTFNYKNLTLRLSGSIVIATADSTANLNEAPLGLIKKIEVIGDGRKLIFSAGAQDVFRLAHILYGKQAELVAPLLTIGTRTFAATIMLNCEALRMSRPTDSFFDPRGFEKVEVRITWGAATDMQTAGGGGTISISASTQVEVQIEQTTSAFGLAGFTRLLSFDEITTTAASSATTQRVPRLGLLAGILFRSYAASLPVDTILNFVSLRSDSAFLSMDRLSYAGLQRQNVPKYQADGGTSGAMVPGYAYLDTTEEGSVQSGLNVLALNNLDLILDNNAVGSSLVRVTYLFFEPKLVGQ